MKKSILALAMVSAFNVAQAQSSVTVYGSIDGGIRNLTNANSAGESRLFMGGNLGLNTPNRLGFKGVEDLGGGLNAHFVLETGFITATGALDNATNQLFQRMALVGLGGSWGTIDLGRQYSISDKTVAAYDPFNFTYLGIINIATGTLGSQPPGTTASGTIRLSNDIQYTGVFGPVTTRVEYALGEQAGSTSNGGAKAVGLSYVNGPFSLGSAYTAQKPNTGTIAAPSWQDRKQWTAGGAYKIDAWRVAAGYMDDKLSTPALGDVKAKYTWGGLTYAFTPAAALTGAYYQTKISGAVPDGKKGLYILGGTYALSKRTSLYTEIDTAKYSGIYSGVYPAPAGQERQTGASVGVTHFF